jgi:hypothetical protein
VCVCVCVCVIFANIFVQIGLSFEYFDIACLLYWAYRKDLIRVFEKNSYFLSAVKCQNISEECCLSQRKGGMCRGK